MAKLPVLKSREVVRTFEHFGWQIARQRGSHIRLKKVTASGEHAITIPEHKVIAKGTLGDIIGRVSLWNSISKEELHKRLGQS